MVPFVGFRAAITPVGNDHGATLLEFAIVSLLVFGFFGAIFDFGITFHKYSLVTHTTNTLARRLAIDFARQSGAPCDELSDQAAEEAKSFVTEELAIGQYLSLRTDENPQGELSFPRLNLTPAGPKTVVMEADLILTCFFCQWFPKTLTISSISTAPIESGSFSCT
jgi:Flp pilus assembly protein TadG